MKNQNAEIQQKIHKEEQFVINNLYEKYKIVVKEKEDLEQKLQLEETQVIEKLQFELDKLKNTEIQLESQIAQLKSSNNLPKLTDKVNEELEEMYQKSIKTKNDYNSELIKLRQEIERIITTNNLLIQRISAAQLNLMTSKNRSGALYEKGTEFPTLFGNNTVKLRRYSDISGGFVSYARSVSNPK